MAHRPLFGTWHLRERAPAHITALPPAPCLGPTHACSAASVHLQTSFGHSVLHEAAHPPPALSQVAQPASSSPRSLLLESLL